MKSNKHSPSSNRWLLDNVNDQYVQQARKIGLRSRAWFKLDEIQRTDKIFQPGITVLDLGSSPGGWSQYVSQKVTKEGRVVACDLLPMQKISGVDFLQGDLRKKSVTTSLFKLIGTNAQVVISDMAPNICGISVIDMSNIIYLVELGLKICLNILEPGGTFIVKIFYGTGFEKYLKKISYYFKKIKIRKPNASRSRSREVYLVATGHKFNN